MSSRLLISVSILVLSGCARSEPVDNSTVNINAAAIAAQGTVDAYGDNMFEAEDKGSAANATVSDTDPSAAEPGNTMLEPLDPPAPGTAGGLPNDRTPQSEARFTPDSAQGAANVLQTYYALLSARRFADARALWQPSAPGAGRDVAEFTKTFDRFSEYHANIGAPGRIDAGAGQRDVTVPVQVYGRLSADCSPSYAIGSAVLHRVAAVDGASKDQRAWRIASITLQPVTRPVTNAVPH
ncbi:hypothetical protein [Sphingomonas sp. TREG-RG-20F-R18-01]|uniref:hypothetical protein n=1 Tax=Sphingomonas sp. TREG-RG-20F-R18-01 TaxID=2914982 RepID=UPI001F5AB312|nr:hypothetical protein [Sphingomonas sp. TREG-RG-20F-R18-01]